MIIIAALTKNRIIGHNNSLPWSIKEESAHFFRTTVGHTLILGRKTFESIDGGKPLPRRKTIVVSRSLLEREDIHVSRTLDEAIQKARSFGKIIFVCGGRKIYRQTLPLVDKLYLSFIKKDYPGDTYFPKLNESEWQITKEENYSEFIFVVYERKKLSPNSLFL